MHTSSLNIECVSSISEVGKIYLRANILPYLVNKVVLGHSQTHFLQCLRLLSCTNNGIIESLQ